MFTIFISVCSTVLQQQKNLEGYVGFASLPNQVYRKSVKRGFEFTLMVVGKNTSCWGLCLFYLNRLIVFTVVGIFKFFIVAFCWKRQRKIVCAAMCIHKGHSPQLSSVNHGGRNHHIAHIVIYLDFRSRTLSHRTDTSEHYLGLQSMNNKCPRLKKMSVLVDLRPRSSLDD